MTGLTIALVGAPDWPDAPFVARAVAALAPDASVRWLPAGAALTPDVDGVWLLAPPAQAPATTHDTTTGWALQLGVPVLGPLRPDEGGSLTPSPGSRLAAIGGEAPVDLPTHTGSARPGRDYVAAPGTIWFAQAHRGAEPAVVTAGGSPFATLTDFPAATADGVHPLALDLVAAARQRAASRHAPAVAPTTGSSLAPLPDDEPRSYVHQMRTAGYRWWRPFLALGAGIVTWFVLAMGLSIAWFVLDPSLLESGGSTADIDPADPVTMLISNLTLAALIPATLVATRVGHWRPMGRLWSVAGRIRWRWLTIASAVTLVIWGGYLAAAWVLSGEQPTERPAHWPWLLVITLLTTPLQSAGEEVAFRGGILQGVGAWIKRPVVALVVGTVLSAATFALAHTSLDPWVLLDLGGMAVACCYLTWRTGGLEAAVVLHVVNNLVIILGLTMLGGLSDAYVTEETTSTAASGGLGVAATFVMTAILLWLARRTGVAPKGFGRPALSPGATPESAAA